MLEGEAVRVRGAGVCVHLLLKIALNLTLH